MNIRRPTLWFVDCRERWKAATLPGLSRLKAECEAMACAFEGIADLAAPLDKETLNTWSVGEGDLVLLHVGSSQALAKDFAEALPAFSTLLGFSGDKSSISSEWQKRLAQERTFAIDDLDRMAGWMMLEWKKHDFDARRIEWTTYRSLAQFADRLAALDLLVQGALVHDSSTAKTATVTGVFWRPWFAEVEGDLQALHDEVWSDGNFLGVSVPSDDVLLIDVAPLFFETRDKRGVEMEGLSRQRLHKLKETPALAFLRSLCHVAVHDCQAEAIASDREPNNTSTCQTSAAVISDLTAARGFHLGYRSLLKTIQRSTC